VRCTFAAGVVSVIQLIINTIGLGWTFIVLSFLGLLSIPLLVVEMIVGRRYRGGRYMKERQKEPCAVEAIHGEPAVESPEGALPSPRPLPHVAQEGEKPESNIS